MGDGDEGGEGRAEEGEQARAPTLSDKGGVVITQRIYKRAAPEIELPRAVNKKQKQALIFDIEGIEGPLPTRKEFLALVQDHVDTEEEGFSLREAISDLVTVRDILSTLLNRSGTEEKLTKKGGQVAKPLTPNREP